MFQAVAELTAYHLMAVLGAMDNWLATQAVEAREILDAYEIDTSDPIRDLLEAADAVLAKGKDDDVAVILGDIRISTRGNHYVIIDDGENAFSLKLSMVAPHLWYYAHVLSGS